MTCVSVIIPVYNGKQYLEQCLDSVRNQSLKEIEIICVDDGSVDSSRDIMERYISKDDRIKGIYQSNKGAGYARNIALKEAEGEYIAFLDADDYYLDTDALEKMYLACKKYQVQISGSLRKSVKGNTIVEESVFDDNKIVIKPDSVYRYEDVQCDYNYQSFLFERELFVKNEIEFPVYRRFEDPVFLVKAMYASKEFCLAGTYLYCYRIPNVSQRFDPDKTLDLLKGLMDNLKFAAEHELEKLFQKTLERLEYEYAGVIFHNISKNGILIISKLLEINELVRKEFDDDVYIIRPLKQVLESVSEENQNYETKLQEKIMNTSSICVYGAGKLAKCFLKYLEEKRLKEKVRNLLVSSLAGNEASLNGIPVVSVDDYEAYENEMIFVAVGGKQQKEIGFGMDKRYIANYELLNLEFLNMLEEKG